MFPIGSRKEVVLAAEKAATRFMFPIGSRKLRFVTVAASFPHVYVSHRE